MRGNIRVLLAICLLGSIGCASDNPVETVDLYGPPVLFPADEAVLTNDYDLSIGTNAADSMVVTFDGDRLAVVTAPPFTLPIILVNHKPGHHTLAVTVYNGESQQQLSSDVLMCHGIGLRVGNYAPSFTLNDLEGVPQRSSALPESRVLLLDFWASWCPPCVSALPETQRLFDEYGDRGLKVLTVNDEDLDTIRTFMAENDYSFPVLHDVTGHGQVVFLVTAIPTYYVLDRQGIVRYVRVGTGGTPLAEVIAGLL